MLFGVHAEPGNYSLVDPAWGGGSALGGPSADPQLSDSNGSDMSDQMVRNVRSLARKRCPSGVLLCPAAAVPQPLGREPARFAHRDNGVEYIQWFCNEAEYTFLIGNRSSHCL